LIDHNEFIAADCGFRQGVSAGVRLDVNESNLETAVSSVLDPGEQCHRVVDQAFRRLSGIQHLLPSDLAREGGQTVRIAGQDGESAI